MLENREIIVHLARLGLSGRVQDVHAWLRGTIKKIEKNDPDLAEQIKKVLSSNSSSPAALREASPMRMPVDADSRLSLVRFEHPVVLETDPAHDGDVLFRLAQVLAERSHLEELSRENLLPSRTLLFSGPPGVGKTLSARWVAASLELPLITLDLATVMSSFLGKTGSNIRSVLDFAKSMECVLLLDEFDAIAKRRDDEGDVGELKRLVTVLLQEIDAWPATSLLIAATNHAELLDPAIWRRFDEVLHFDLPTREQRGSVIRKYLGEVDDRFRSLIPLLEQLWEGRSNSDIARAVKWLRRRSTVTGATLDEALLEQIGREAHAAPASEKRRMIALLSQLDIPQRRISAVTGISRDTLRKHRAADQADESVLGQEDN